MGAANRVKKSAAANRVKKSTVADREDNFLKVLYMGNMITIALFLDERRKRKKKLKEIEERRKPLLEPLISTQLYRGAAAPRTPRLIDGVRGAAAPRKNKDFSKT